MARSILRTLPQEGIGRALINCTHFDNASDFLIDPCGGNGSLCYSFHPNCSSYTWSNVSDVSDSNIKLNSSEPDAAYVFFRNQSRFWVQRVLVPLIMLIGVIGNSITIVIMTRRRMRSSTNNYLAALAIFDMLYLVFTFLLSFSHYPNSNDPAYYIYWRLWPFALMITDACSNTSIWLTVTFTIERYVAVCHPIKGKVLCTETRAKKVIICVFIICFTLTLPTPFEWTIIETFNPKTNSTYLEATFSELGNNDLYKTIYYWLTVVLFTFIPLILLAIFNSFLIRSVHLSRRQRNTMTRARDSRDSSKQESRITMMLIAVVILFFICQLPTAFTLLYTSFHNVVPNSNEHALLRGLGNIFNFLMAINAAGNFVLYCLLSQKYRRTFLQTFCPCLKGKFYRLQSVYQHTVYSNVDNEGYSPGLSRKLSTRATIKNSPKMNGSKQAPSFHSSSRKDSYLNVPSEKKSSSFAEDEKNLNDSKDDLETSFCTKCSGNLRGPWPWKKIRKTSLEKGYEEQTIPLKAGTHCIVISNSENGTKHPDFHSSM